MGAVGRVAEPLLTPTRSASTARIITIPYAPRRLQSEIHAGLDANRFGVAVCHRRFGKTVLAVNHLIRAALLCRKVRPRFAYLAPTYRQGKAVAWDYLKHYADVVDGRVINESELRIDFPNQSQVRIFGADNPDALRGLYLDGVVPDEFGMMDGRVWSEVLRPALSDRMGWAFFIGTPNGKNSFWEMRDRAATGGDWILWEFKASETGIIPQSELDAARSTMTADEYAQEFECSFEASVRGAIYADELALARADERITRVPYDPALPVDTFWDIGIGDAMSIWFVQQHASEVRVIDYYENEGEGFPHYAQVLRDRRYVYGKHNAPHDIVVREVGSGRSRIETAEALGIKFEIVPNIPIEEGIHAARMLFPRCYFDEAHTRVGREALQNYRRDYNQRLGEFKATPVHDWASNGADAWRYLAVGLQKPAAPRKSSVDPLRSGSGGWMR